MKLTKYNLARLAEEALEVASDEIVDEIKVEKAKSKTKAKKAESKKVKK